MEILFAIGVFTAIFYSGAKTIVEDIGDIKYAAKGKDHPRWAYRQAKLEAARKGEPTGYWQLLVARAWDKAFNKGSKASPTTERPAKGPRPLRDYFGKCWADAVKTEEIKHDKRVADRRAKRAATAGDVEAPVDTDLVPDTVPPEGGIDDAFDTVPRDTPGAVEGVDGVTTPVDESPIPTASANSGAVDQSPVPDAGTATTAVGQPWSPYAPSPDELDRIALARRRARAYLYLDGIETVDRKPDFEDIGVLEDAPDREDREMGWELRSYDVNLDRRWRTTRERLAATDVEDTPAPAPIEAPVDQGPDPLDTEPAAIPEADLPPEFRFPKFAEQAEHEGMHPRAVDAILSALDRGEERIELPREFAGDKTGITLDSWSVRENGRKVDIVVAPAGTEPEEALSRTDRSAIDDSVPDNVIPFNKPLPTPKGIEPMPTTTEIDGLESAIAWAAEVKTNAADMASGIDDVEGDFAARKVSGETLALVGQIGEAYDELRGLAAQLEGNLQNMQSVGEAYEAAPDAGDKEFVTS